MRLFNRKPTCSPAASEKPSILGNDRGIALVMALILGLIGMLMIVSLLYMAGTGIWTSGSKKRYQTALEASHGGMNFFAKEIIQRGVGGTTLFGMGTYGGIFDPGNPGPTDNTAASAAFNTKLTTTGIIGDAGYPVSNPDATMTLAFVAPNPNMTINAAILGSSRGNSGTSQNVLVGGGVVNSNSGTVTPQHIPYLYQTDIQGQSTLLFSRERARLSSVYAY